MGKGWDRDVCVVGTCCCSPGGSSARGSVMQPVPPSAMAGFGSGWARSGLVARLSLPAQPHCSIPRCVPHGCCQCWHPEGRADATDCGAHAAPAHHQGGKCGLYGEPDLSLCHGPGQGAENASVGLGAVLQLCTLLSWLLGPQAAGVFPGLDQGERKGGLEDAG